MSDSCLQSRLGNTNFYIYIYFSCKLSIINQSLCKFFLCILCVFCNNNKGVETRIMLLIMHIRAACNESCCSCCWNIINCLHCTIFRIIFHSNCFSKQHQIERSLNTFHKQTCVYFWTWNIFIYIIWSAHQTGWSCV